MKKRFLILAFAIMFMICPLLVGCGDSIVGVWKIAGYSYEFNGEEKVLTLEDADAIVYDGEITNITSEQFYLNQIAYINDSRDQSTFDFKSDKKLILATNEYEWSYDGDKVVITMNEMQVTFEKLENGQLKMVFPIGDISINIMLEK